MIALNGNSVIQDLKLFFQGMIRGDYPGYLFRNTDCSQIPVFCYHSVTTNEFESNLEHLSRNKYITLTADEFHELVKQHGDSVQQSVLLTFDDGLSDVYEVVFPLLQRYQMKVVVFIIPNWVGKEGILSWDQIQEMHESGLVDFQSHSMSHPAIFISPEIVDFYRPGMSNLKLWNLPGYRNNGKAELNDTLLLGSPIYEYHSRFSEYQRFVPDEHIREYCHKFVMKNGGIKFFSDKYWKDQLLKLVEEYREKEKISEQFETVGNQVASIRTELEQSREIIEQKLPGKKVFHFASPWNEMSPLTHQLLRELKYKISFIGLRDFAELKTSDSDLLVVKRLSGDFVKCLPGKGRQSFLQVIFSKVLRRITSGANY